MTEFSDSIYTVTAEGEPVGAFTTLEAALADIEAKRAQEQRGDFLWGELDITTVPISD